MTSGYFLLFKQSDVYGISSVLPIYLLNQYSETHKKQQRSDDLCH